VVEVGQSQNLRRSRRKVQSSLINSMPGSWGGPDRA
jgi:hypothetical protein